MELFDVHSHILPAFDDGAKTVEVSLRLIDELRKQGVTNICLTPHFYTNEMSLEDYLVKRQAAFEKFMPYIPADINIVLGCEVYVTEYMFNNSDLSALAYGNSPYILTEFPYGTHFTEKTLQKFYMLLQNYKLIPVMPHVERYPNLMDNPESIEMLREMGVLIQTNISNYTKEASFFKKRKLLKYISKGMIDLLGSDTHSMTHNPPNVFSEAMQTITQKCGERHMARMMDNASHLFNKAL